MDAQQELQKAHDTLTRYQAWRTGEDERTMEGAGVVPSEVSYAIEVALISIESHLDNKKGA